MLVLVYHTRLPAQTSIFLLEFQSHMIVIHWPSTSKLFMQNKSCGNVNLQICKLAKALRLDGWFFRVKASKKYQRGDEKIKKRNPNFNLEILKTQGCLNFWVGTTSIRGFVCLSVCLAYEGYTTT